MKQAMSYVIVAAIALLAACAGAPAKKPDATAKCNDTPQWVTKDAAGNAVGIYICFGDDNRLLYSARFLPTPPPPAPADEPEAGSVPGRWDRPECERYKPEAQKAFCKWIPEPATAAAKPSLSAEEKHFLEVGRAEVARMKALTDKGLKRAKPAAAPASLPTASGTAK